MKWLWACSIMVGVPDRAASWAVNFVGMEFFVECYRRPRKIGGAGGMVNAGEPGALCG